MQKLATSKLMIFSVLFMLHSTGFVTRAYGQQKVETVAVTGQFAPGAIDTIFSRFFVDFNFNLNNQGAVAFRGKRAGVDVDGTNDTGIWIYEPGDGLRQFLREGDSTPNNGGEFTRFTRVSLNDNGQLAFSASASDANDEYIGVWSTSTGSTRLVVREDDSAPDVDGVFSGGFGLLMNGNGQVAFRAGVDGVNIDPSHRRGIWREAVGGGLELVFHEGHDAPGTNAKLSGIGSFDFNDAGEIAFGGRWEPQVFSESDYGVWSDAGRQSLELVVRTGSPVPGTNATFDLIDGPILGADGSIAFAASVEPGTNGTNKYGIWRDRGDASVDLLFSQSSARAPGTPARFIDSFKGLEYNDAGHIAFFADLFGRGVNPDNIGGFWAEGPNDELALIARNGSVAPGTDLPFARTFSNRGGDRGSAFNNNSQVAILATVIDSSIDPRRPVTYFGIWAQDSDGELKLIALEGKQLDISTDAAVPDLRTIAELDF